MPETLLRTKLFVPPPRSNLVPRPRLLERVTAGMAGPLTLVSAPAGYGKTTLIAEWRAGPGPEMPVAWLSLDEQDNDPARFWLYFLTAVDTIHQGLADEALSLFSARQLPPIDTLLTILVNDLSEFSQDFVLVLDDLHVVTTSEVHHMLAFLLDHLPPQMHLVILTREDPPLPLSRLRARQEMIEIRLADLRFSATETATLLNDTMGMHLTPEQIETLNARTEGWISGLQLAALSLKQHSDIAGFVRSFAGSNRYILDYLMDEVFQQQPDEMQAFLLKTSILARFNASLCDAMCAVDDDGGSTIESRKTLRTLEQANLFLVPLDEARQWYRYHHLFADILRQRLGLVTRYNPADLHGRASRWYIDHGFITEAIHHALAAADWEYAVELLVEHHDRFLKQGEVLTVLKWFEELPDQIIESHPRACYEYSWPLILSEQYAAAKTYLSRAEEAAMADNDGPLLTRVCIARGHIARARGEYEQVITLSEQALSLLPPGELSARSVVSLNLGLAQWYRGRLREARQAFTAAERAGRESGNAYIRLSASAFLCRIMAAQGGLHQAADNYHRLIEESDQQPFLALAYIDLAGLYYEWNDLVAAEEQVKKGLELARRGEGESFRTEGLALLAMIYRGQGDHAAAQRALGEAGLLVEHSDISSATRLQVQASQAALAISQGDVDAAWRIVDDLPKQEEAASFPAYLQLAVFRAHALLARGRRAQAGETLTGLYDLASETGWNSMTLRIRALQSLAASSTEKALAYLGDGLRAAQPEGYIRTFVDLGDRLQPILANYRIQVRQKDRSSQHLAYVEKLLAALPAGKPTDLPGTSRQESSIIDLAEPLSDREMEALQLLAEGKTYREIAQTMVLSVNTVKSHLKSIYGKLGVHDRRQAVTQARKHHLLTPRN